MTETKHKPEWSTTLEALCIHCDLPYRRHIAGLECPNLHQQAKVAADLLDISEKNADTFHDAAVTLKLFGHPGAAEAMSIAENATRAIIEKAKGG